MTQDERLQKILKCCEKFSANTDKIEALKTEAAALREKVAALEEENEKIEAYMPKLVPVGSDWSYGEHAVNYKESKAVVVDDEAALPANCVRTKVEPNKKMIGALLEAGTAVAGARIETRQNVQIK